MTIPTTEYATITLAMNDSDVEGRWLSALINHGRTPLILWDFMGEQSASTLVLTGTAVKVKSGPCAVQPATAAAPVSIRTSSGEVSGR